MIGAKAVYAYFCSFAGAGDTCFPSREKMCIDLAITKNTLSKYITQLVKNGYITVEQIKENGRFSRNVYTLCGEVQTMEEASATRKTASQKTAPQKTVSQNLGYEKMTPNNNNTKTNSFNNNNPNNREGTKRKRFTPPTLEEVEKYCLERKNGINPAKFMSYYESNGWRVGGKSPMRDWKAAVRSWELRENDYKPKNGKPDTSEDWSDDLDGYI